MAASNCQAIGMLQACQQNRRMTPLPDLLAELEADRLLRQPQRVLERLDALDAIERRLTIADGAEDRLISRARTLAAELEASNEAWYQSIRDDIRAGRGAARLLACVSDEGPPDGDGYDALDELVGGVLQFDQPRTPVTALTGDMVFYQPTPARHIFAMLKLAGLGENDLLVDLGSGLGHVPLLAALCTGARAIGIEIEPAYVACARQAAAGLALPGVSFLQQDARTADVGIGTVFYLYTPFRGAILREVLDRLRAEASRREIRLCTFGPCTTLVAREPWLLADDEPRTDRVAVFRSRRQRAKG
jgi:hypothetical protein